MGILLGRVIEVKNKYVKLKLNDSISLHDGIEILSGDEIKASTIVTCIMDEKLNIINKTLNKGNTIFIGDINKKVNIGDLVYKTSSISLNNDLKKYYDGTYQKRKKINISLKFKKNEKISVMTYIFNEKVIIDFEYIPNIAKTHPTTLIEINDSFSKTLDTLFVFNIESIELDDNVFVPISIINKLRKKLVEKIQEIFETYTRTEVLDINKEQVMSFTVNKKVYKENILYIYRFDGNKDYFKYYNERYNKRLECVYINIYDMILNEKGIFNQFQNRSNIYIVLPNVCGENIQRYINNNMERLIQKGVSGIAVGNIGYIDLVKHLKERYNILLIADYPLNVFNSYSANFYSGLGFDIIAPSFELSSQDLQKMSQHFNIEIVKDYISVMTSRYCILGTYISNRKNGGMCKMPCNKDKYYLKDFHGKKYHIISNNLDCTSIIISQTNEDNDLNARFRRSIL